jgi:hypothetical protein
MLGLFNKISDRYPKLELGTREGMTGYIDFLLWHEIDSPIVWGVDAYGRKFFVMKFVTGKGQQVMETYFQRYVGSELWHSCGHANFEILNTSGTGLTPEQSDFLDRLYRGDAIACDRDRCETYRIFNIRNTSIRLMTDSEVKESLHCRYSDSTGYALPPIGQLETETLSASDFVLLEGSCS